MLSNDWKGICRVLLPLLWLSSCRPSSDRLDPISTRHLGALVHTSTEIMIHDVSNPPLAMRFYAYILLAGHEAMAGFDGKPSALLGQLNGYERFRHAVVPDADSGLTALLAMSETASSIQPSGGLMKDWTQQLMDSLRVVGWPEKTLSASHGLARLVSEHVMKYARSDGYVSLNRFPRYRPRKTDSTWYATPPGYFPAVEPFFNHIRPFLIDSAQSATFAIPPPVPYSNDPGGGFYRQLQEVVAAGNDTSQRAIAAFWDCNPFALSENGHLMIGLKKISPGGHWMGIAQIACEMRGLGLRESLAVQSTLSAALMDAFWLCWKEKYRTDRIRPETAVRRILDSTWSPFLQTPPFPEYPSGHSVVSTTASAVLTGFFGPSFAYTDTVERRYGIPDRAFRSFEQAAEEAAISRLYGGIHYRDGIVNGQLLGRKLSSYLVEKMMIERLGR